MISCSLCGVFFDNEQLDRAAQAGAWERKDRAGLYCKNLAV
jgi:hypothetical protein